MIARLQRFIDSACASWYGALAAEALRSGDGARAHSLAACAARFANAYITASDEAARPASLA